MATPIVEEIRKVKEICTIAKESKDVDEKVEIYKSFQEMLNKEYNRFETLINQYRILKSVRNKVKDDSNLKDCFLNFRDSFSLLVDSIRNNESNNQQFIALKGLNSTFESLITQNWNKFVKDKIESKYKTLEVCQEFIGNELFTELKRYHDTLLISHPSQTSIKDIEHFVNKATEIISGMDADEEILTFISKVSNRRAYLSDLTDNVMKWIKEHKFDSKIKIVM